MSSISLSPYRIAAIVPCHNEEQTVAQVVTDLKAAVPDITVFVYDNCSTDATVEGARAAGAVVCHEPLKGKGNVVRRAFADIEADIYLLIDGDDTYDAAAAPRMIEKLLLENLDQVVGVRREVAGADAYRKNHEWGNKLLNGIVARIFGDSHGDMLSGYRIFSRRFVKSFPAVSREFEIETELTVHSLACRIPSATVEVDFKDRPAGSESKLRTYHDGFRILSVIISLARHERPVLANGMVSAMMLAIAALLAVPVFGDYVRTGQVPRLPSLTMAGVISIAGVLVFLFGLSQDSSRKARHESSRLTYLRHSAVRSLMNGPQVQDLLEVGEAELELADMRDELAASARLQVEPTTLPEPAGPGQPSALAAFERELETRMAALRTMDPAS